MGIENPGENDFASDKAQVEGIQECQLTSRGKSKENQLIIEKYPRPSEPGQWVNIGEVTGGHTAKAGQVIEIRPDGKAHILTLLNEHLIVPVEGLMVETRQDRIERLNLQREETAGISTEDLIRQSDERYARWKLENVGLRPDEDLVESLVGKLRAERSSDHGGE